jgi:hypothetical protein
MVVLNVDMYSDRPFGSVGYRPGEPLEVAIPFFDRTGYQLRPDGDFPPYRFTGGARARVLRALPNWPPGQWPPLVSKVPLLRWHPGQWLGGGCHIMGPQPLAPLRGALLHFKALDDWPEKCVREVVRGQHYKAGLEYHWMGRAIARLAGGSFFDPEHSVRYEGPGQLVELGLMHESDPFGISEPAWSFVTDPGPEPRWEP